MVGLEIGTDEYHTAGEPFRIVTSGVPVPQGVTVLDRRSWCQDHLDDVRALLINEPRGHADMYGGFPVPPDSGDGDLGVVFFHKDGFSTACGHGTIALVTWAIDTGRIAAEPNSVTPVTVDVPSGRLRTEATVDHEGRVIAVRFWNVPAYVTGRDIAVDSPWGRFTVHVSYGGAFYASIAVDDAELRPEAGHLTDLIAAGRHVKEVLNEHRAVNHADPRLSGLYGVIFHETLDSSTVTGGTGALVQRNVTVFADGEVDRSPCGSGTSARLAVLQALGQLEPGRRFLNLGVAGGVFEGRIEAMTATDERVLVHTSVSGAAFRTGSALFTQDDRDPLGPGFQLR